MVHQRLCLFGPDGSGKSTLARLLANYVSRDNNVRISWIRGSHMAASLLARFLALFPSMRGADNPYYGISIPRNLRPLWWFLEFISVLPNWFFRFIMPSFYETVIGERGLLDFLVWVCVTTEPVFLRTLWGRATLALSLRHCRNVFIIADLKVLIRRKGREPTARTLPRQWVIYNALARYLNLSRVDTSSSTPIQSLIKLINELNMAKQRQN
ncbi:Thymidylate kinase-like protein [Vulcanisaeta moutnovskia 768-28]|uniref:Thymidylate kinase-like protein n=1 Tax=Vulcanisaeta moutnovskia (strain 768-28) TaxID=985053 RepID=F0QXS7_VULM7|nr:ATP-binding protein [Vulcanisaeta moutnovskia]ADY01240.1 Thymidylate kinase-like protein [Vulcanisaeta moutnovskia 768-28]